MNNFQSIYFTFEKLVVDLLQANGYIPLYPEKISIFDIGVDFIAEKNGEIFVFEIKLFRYKKDGRNLLSNAAQLLSRTKLINIFSDNLNSKKIRKIIICSLELTSEEKVSRNISDVEIWDINELIGLASEVEDKKLKEDFRNFIINNFVDFNEQKLLPLLESLTSQVIGKKLIGRLTTLGKGKDYWKQYEVLGLDILKFLFSDSLTGWFDQRTTTDGLFRYDIICRIKSYGNNDEASFWAELAQDCRTRYIIFDLKNYSKKITQGEVYTTEKYLLAKAMRTVAFVISRHGANKNAFTATQGIIRESGKVILLLDDNDLIKMLEYKISAKEPAMILLEKIDELFTKLPK